MICQLLHIVDHIDFFSTKTKAQAEKYFWKNSALIYKWKKRTDKQPSLT